ncbi:hypothetical protein CPB84DRAFT_1848782 [Gymnopilus junonius]|uniref:Uncharacterized protein n=1 Tax=Gymnopilus junonius TaxID=109634 RepID=A0A9P5NHL5_GYMJU|nr:hypothetical protein CPB84DRAFT_1848782 [Gymnopilus junonius]
MRPCTHSPLFQTASGTLMIAPGLPPLLKATRALRHVSGGNAPVGTRAFRKDITLPPGQRATSATFLVGADNGHTLYLQGNIVGSGNDYHSAQRYVADLEPSASQISIVAFTAKYMVR